MKPKIVKKSSDTAMKADKIRNGKVKKPQIKNQTILKEKSSKIGDLIKQVEPKKLSSKKALLKKTIKDIDKTTQNLQKTVEKAPKVLPKVKKTTKLDKTLKKERSTSTSPEKQKSDKLEESDNASERTVFVGNLPVNTKRKQLARFFENCGNITSIRFRTAAGLPIFKHAIRKMAGSLIAFVVFETPEMTDKAMALNGSMLKGNNLRINKSNVKEPTELKRTIFVGNLKYSTTEQSLRDIFQTCGDIKYVRCLQHKMGKVDKGCKGVAYICFETPDAVSLALELEGTMLNDRPIHVERFNEKKMDMKSKKKAMEVETGKSKSNTSVLNNEAEVSPVEGKKSKKKFAGVKINSTKSKDKLKSKNKKKKPDEMTKLAKKIAPN